MSEQLDSIERQLREALDRLDELTDEVPRLSAAVAEQALETRRRTRLLWGALLVGALILAGMIAVTLDNSRAIDANNQKLCPILSLLIPRPGDAQPQTPRGQEVASRASLVYEAYHCDR